MTDLPQRPQFGPLSDLPGQLTFYDDVSRGLAQLDRVDEVKVILDKATALQEYARRAKDTDLIQHATNVRLRAERRAGELLIEMAERGEREAKGGDRKSKSHDATLIKPPKLADVGINKTQSSRWQGLAALKPDAFEHKVECDTKTAYDRMTGRFLKEEEDRRARKAHAKVIEQGCTVADLEELIAAGKKFGVICPDFPWQFEVYSGKGKQRSAERHYDTMSLADIMAMAPLIAQLAAPHCALFLWGVCPEPPGALELIEAAGFEYKTVEFSWLKTTPNAEVITLDGKGLHWGMGYSTRANIEPVLLATRGNPRRMANDVHQVVIAPVSKHSEKPAEIYRRIERLYPGPYLELFARREREHWTVWGDEIKRTDFQQYDALDDINKRTAA